MCIAQGYQRAVCVNRKKLEHRWVCIAPGQVLTNTQITHKFFLCSRSLVWGQHNQVHSQWFVLFWCVFLLATVVIIKHKCLLLNDRLIDSGDMKEGTLLHAQVDAAVLWISTAATVSEPDMFVCPLFCRLKQPALRSPDGNCLPCPISSSGPVCGSDGHNYASKVHWNKYTTQ